jgi:oligopeptide/dipeptide ABC transporter ATP-binding protein
MADSVTPPRDAAGDPAPLLSVRNLSVEFAAEEGQVQAVRDISFDLRAGEILGLVGESGSGKSVSMSSLLRLNPSPPARITSGSVSFQGTDLLKLSERQMRRYRGREIAMVFQDPATSLNPVQTVGSQITEAMRVHDRGLSRRDARTRAIELLDLVGVPSPKVRFSQYPHEYSGGMRQRAMIAMALSNRPKLLIADEPTTALDVTVQAQILDMLQDIQREADVSIIMITHDIGIIAEIADRVLVMYAGKIVEAADVQPIFEAPLHPYTRGLFSSLPRLETPAGDLPSIPGQPPSLNPPPSGCAFHPRCELSAGRERCRTEQPDLTDAGGQHDVACHFYTELLAPEPPGAAGEPAGDAAGGYKR